MASGKVGGKGRFMELQTNREWTAIGKNVVRKGQALYFMTITEKTAAG